jgi:TfoX/Sxy family transcriptional regulator of competence genes
VAYDEGLAARLLDELGGEPGLRPKKMFGGLAVLIGGNMAVGVFGEDLLVRIDPGQQAVLLAEPGARRFEMTSRSANGWIVVDAAMCAEDDDLRRWVARGVARARSLPPK